MADLVAWRLYWQDYRGVRIGMGDRPPEPQSFDFPPTNEGRAAACRMRDTLRDEAIRDEAWAENPHTRQAADLLLSIAPIALKAAKPSRKQSLAAWGDALPMLRRPPREGMR